MRLKKFHSIAFMKSCFLSLLSIMIFLACSDEETEAIETFDDKDRPFFTYDGRRDQYVLLPWNYDKPENKDRSYPLIVYLHIYAVFPHLFFSPKFTKFPG